MASTISPNMSLIVPGVGTEPGPTWANDLNADLGILDQHDHSSGRGVPITPAGLDISTDLSINSNNLTDTRTIRFTSQVTFLTGISPDLGVVYVAGNELYYNDESGNVVQITNMGSVNAGAGSISGLPSGTASASYSSGSQTFVWQSATSTAANMDMGSITIREVLAGANGITISSPTSLAANYTMTLPTALPASLSFLSLDNSGNIGVLTYPLTAPGLASNSVTTAKILDANVTRPKLEAVGQQISSSSGAFQTTSSSLVDVTNLSVTITTTGRPVVINVQSDTTNGGSFIQLSSSGGTVTADLALIRDATQITQYRTQNPFGSANSLIFVMPSMTYIDPVSAGTYTYKIQAMISSPGTFGVQRAVLVAYEL